MNALIVFILSGVVLPLPSSECLPPLFSTTLFGGRPEKPLLALSLESSEADTEPAPASIHHRLYDEDEFYPLSRQQLRRVTSSKRFYDMVLGVLHVLERQARQEVQRAREQLETGRSATDSDKDEQPA
uniref:Corticotropin-releasing factor domain-containing protein n=1 Tax=Anopheles dirus TaxID=7168 RepID=A0A182NYM3_9DIPT